MKSRKRAFAVVMMVAVSLAANGITPSSSREGAGPGTRLQVDPFLVAPGAGADGVALGEEIDLVLRRYGRDRFRKSRPAVPGELFRDVFGVDAGMRIRFESIYYNDEKKIAVCVVRERVGAIIGLSADRVTTEGVDLGKGISNFIFNYGNRGLAHFTSGQNGIYLYRELGIGAVDDGMNDRIDLYIVFTPHLK